MHNALEVRLGHDRLVNLFVGRLSVQQPHIPCDFASLPNDNPDGFLLIAHHHDDLPLWELRIENFAANPFVQRHSAKPPTVRRTTVDLTNLPLWDTSWTAGFLTASQEAADRLREHITGFDE